MAHVISGQKHPPLDHLSHPPLLGLEERIHLVNVSAERLGHRLPEQTPNLVTSPDMDASDLA